MTSPRNVTAGVAHSRTRNVAILALFLTAQLTGQPAARKWGVDLLADQVDAIVVGELLATQATGKSASGVLSVTRTIKGSLEANDRVNIAWNLWSADEQDRKGAHGIWYLRQVRPGQWSLVTPWRSLYVPIARGVSPSGIRLPAAVATLPRPATTADHVAAEVVAALQSYRDREEIRLLATVFFACDSTPFVRQLHRVLRASSDPELAFIGLVPMLRGQRDLSALKEMATHIGLIPKLVVSGQVQTAIMSVRDGSQESIQFLTQFASSQDANLQYAAADVLSALHTRDTLPVLVQLLDSPHENVRRLSMSGLSAFVLNLPVQTAENVPTGRASMPQGPAPYRTAETDRYRIVGGTPEKGREAEYIQFWKGWWARMRGELMKR